MTREHELELFDAQENKVVATFWWDGKKVQAEPANYLESANERAPNNKTVADGIEFLEALPSIYRNGYLSMKRKKT